MSLKLINEKENPRPSSTRFCRPIRLLIKVEEEKMNNQISDLTPTNVTIVKHKL